MLETLTREIRPGITITVREPSNADYYAARRLYERLITKDDDDDMQSMKSRFVLIATRTASVTSDGSVSSLSVCDKNTDEEIAAAFASFMDLPHKLSEKWVELASEVGETASKN